ncbi:hypothetical protein [Aestuariivirga sp.]|uniref:hypothetical protein n=1 Tax=Aestuariivirga sp. TaxID=2650926 RepID=UPI0039E3EDE9
MPEPDDATFGDTDGKRRFQRLEGFFRKGQAFEKRKQLLIGRGIDAVPVTFIVRAKTMEDGEGNIVAGSYSED